MTTNCNHRADSQGNYCAECRAMFLLSLVVG